MMDELKFQELKSLHEDLIAHRERYDSFVERISAEEGRYSIRARIQTEKKGGGDYLIVDPPGELQETILSFVRNEWAAFIDKKEQAFRDFC